MGLEFRIRIGLLTLDTCGVKDTGEMPLNYTTFIYVKCSFRSIFRCLFN